LPLFELIGLLRRYRERRERENLSQKELLKREVRVIGLALLVILCIVGLGVLLISTTGK
jgi:hypothetical protein